jgi:peptide/nickel transport system substrate-binding protein
MAAAFVLSLALPACTAKTSSNSAATAGHDGGTLVWAKPAEVASTDPSTDGAGVSWEIFNEVYDTLVTLDGANKVVPALATSWTQPSPTEYLFDIRQGVKFSNGRVMTVADVVGSLHRVMSPKLASFWAPKLGIASVTAVGDHQVKIKLAKPLGSFLAALAGIQSAILPMKEIDSGTFDPKKGMLGTGPYQVKDHFQDQSWTLVRNPHYWGRPARAATVVVKIMKDDSARIAALRSGGADVTTFMSPDAVTLLKGQANVRAVVQETNNYYRIDVNAKTSVFKDRRLRQALALSVDRSKITSVALAGVGRPSAAIAPGFKACDPGAVPFARPDAAQAKTLVSAAGAQGKTVTILVAPTYPTYAPIAQVIQQGLEATGLKVKIEQVDMGVLVKRAFSGKSADFDLAIGGYGNFADPTMILSNWNPALATFSAGYYVDDPGLDTMLDRAIRSAPGNGRGPLLQQICGRIAQNANVIPLVTTPSIVAYRSDRIQARVNQTEAYSIPLRDLAAYTVSR